MTPPFKRPRAASVTAALLLLAALAAGCGDDAPPPSTSATNNGATNNGANNNGSNNGGPLPCGATSECLDDGLVCIGELCRACLDDATCAGEPEYGAGATCEDGRCVSCFGEQGCACQDGGTCQGALVCTDGICAPCPQGDAGCACFPNGTCFDDLACQADACVACPWGSLACPCTDGATCDDGLTCMEERCAPEDCVVGADGCPCGPDDACDDGLTCADDGMCAPCTDDVEGCPCADATTCSGGLICDAEQTLCRAPLTCDDLACALHQRCAPEDLDAPEDAACLEACDPGFMWSGAACEPIPSANCVDGAPASISAECDAAHRTCVEVAMGAMCAGCLPDHLEEAGACRAAVTCATLGASCTADHRACVPHTTSTDASCGACTAGYEEVGGACVPQAQANCQPDTLMSILATCIAQGRVCNETASGASCGACAGDLVEHPTAMTCVPPTRCADLDCLANNRACSGEPFATCGGCLVGWLEDGGLCRAPLTCAALDCGATGQFCVEGDLTTDATCATWPCTDANGDPDYNRAQNPNNGVCVDCNIACGDTGETGTLWPFTLAESGREGRCICETQTGYYYDAAPATAQPCDADGDGWVRESAREAITSADRALRDNARCGLRTIDRFSLRNELQQELDVRLCVEGLVAATPCATDADCAPGRCFDGTCGCIEADTIDLYESRRNDDQAELDANLDAPAHQTGGRGRKLRASELNPLTRACVSETADYNDNDLADVNEWQGLRPDSMPTEAAITLLAFSYFTELHTSWFVPPANDEAHGRYVIAERSRCDPDFPLTYDPDVDPNAYWRDCSRNRDASFHPTADAPAIGYDFARWSCRATGGTCPTPPPPTDLTPTASIPPHGLCDPDLTLPPVDGIWRGMNHHSQFKCAVIDDLAPADPVANPQILADEALTNAAGRGRLQFNRCGVACPGDDLDCAADCASGTCADSSTPPDQGLLPSNPHTPRLTCEAVPSSQVSTDDVGFVAVRYDGTRYTRGCINEWVSWPSLCPGYEANPSGTMGQGHDKDFGRLVCGCGFNFGGTACDLGCTADRLSYGGEATPDQGTCDNGYCVVTNADGGRSGYWLCAGVGISTYEQPDATDGPAFTGWGYKAIGEVPYDGVDRTRLCEGDCSSGYVVQ